MRRCVCLRRGRCGRAGVLTVCLYKFRNRGVFEWHDSGKCDRIYICPRNKGQKLMFGAGSRERRANTLRELIDERFPDGRMERIYAKMKFSVNGQVVRV